MQFLTLLFSILLQASPAQTIFATSMPHGISALHAPFHEDTAKTKRHIKIVIRDMDENGNEKETVHEFNDFRPFADSLAKKFRDRFDFPEMDSLLRNLKVEIDEMRLSFSPGDSSFGNIWEYLHIPAPDMRGFRARLDEFRGPFLWHGRQAEIRIVDLDKSDLDEYDIGKNDLSLDQFAYYPNPGKGSVTIEFSAAQKKPVRIKVYDLTGRTWFEESIAAFDGNYKRELPVVLPQGVYILRIEQQNKIMSKKLVVEQ